MYHPANAEPLTASDIKPSRRRPARLASAAIAAVLVIAAGMYVAGQYLSATHPKALSDLPQYPYSGSALAFDRLTAQQRAEAEMELRTVANSVQPGYHVSSERLMAATGEFVWDAVRSSVDGYLSPSSFRIQLAGQLPGAAGDPAYIVWARTNRLQTLFNQRRILAVGAQHPVQATAPGPEIHAYGYFDLSPDK